MEIIGGATLNGKQSAVSFENKRVSHRLAQFCSRMAVKIISESIGIMEQLYVFLSRIARQHAFFLGLVLMREVEILLVETGDVFLTVNQEE